MVPTMSWLRASRIYLRLIFCCEGLEDFSSEPLILIYFFLDTATRFLLDSVGIRVLALAVVTILRIFFCCNSNCCCSFFLSAGYF
jgi:hypothetical protein